MEEYLEWLSEDDEDEEYAQVVWETTDVIVAKLKGQAEAGLEDEGYAGYVAASILRRHVDGDSPPRTPFEVKHHYWYDLLDNHADTLGAEAELFEHIAAGRPLFGRSNSECYYALFDRAEAIRLRDAARRIAGGPRMPQDEVWILTDPHEGLAGCIDQILVAGYDVWLETPP